MTWYKELKFSKNPLDIRPNPNIIGLKEQEKKIIDHILKEDICFVNGLTGSGKTSMLLRVQRLMKNHEFIYLDAHDLPLNFRLESELKKKRSFFDRIALRDFPKDKPVLIIDEFQATDPRLILNARSKWENPDKRIIKSIVVSQISRHLDNCSDSFKERIGSKIVEMKPLSHEELKEMLKRRLFNKQANLNFAERFSEEALDVIVRSAGKNPRKVLEYAEQIFDYHHKRFKDLNPMRRKDYTVSHHVVRQILSENDIYVEPASKMKKQQVISGAELEKNIKPSLTLPLGLERNILDFINQEPRTIKDASKQFNISTGKAKKIMDGLKKANLLVPKGKKGRMKLWEVDAEVKRLLVES